jgi:hypothetical protein
MKTLIPNPDSTIFLSEKTSDVRRAGPGKLHLPGVLLLAASVLGGASPALAQTAPPTSQPVIVADFNHDGIPDALVLSTTTPTATIAFGSVPYGTFAVGSKGVTFPAACTTLPAGSVAVGDFNGDGFPDIAYFCASGSGTMLGNGDGTFGAATTLAGAGAGLAVVGDFNKDGKLDIAILVTTGVSAPSQAIQLLAGNGDGTFQEAVLSNLTTSSYTAMVVTDVNADGFPDLLLLNSPTDGTASVDVYGNNQDGTFGSGAQGVFSPSTSGTLASGGATTILTGNIFGALTTDVVVPTPGQNGKLYVFQNTSSGTTFSFNDPVTVPVANLTGAQTGRFTGSGFTDVAVSNGATISVLANDGKGNPGTNYATLALSSTSPLFAVADANGDGYSDIYTAALPSTGALQLAVALTSGTATATSQPISLAVGTRAIGATWAGNVNFTGSNATGSQIVVGVASVTTLASSKNPSLVTDSVTFTVHVAPGPNAGSNQTPTGTVVLMDGTNMLASGVLDDGGNFSFTTAALTQATHVITANYAGDALYAPSVAMLSQVVNHAPAVAPTLTWATPAPIPYGTPLSVLQLNAAATDANGATIPGVFVYSPAAGTVLGLGSQTLSVTFTPSDLLSFTVATKTVNLVVTGVTVSSFTPTTATLGAGATKVTITGAGFVGNSVVQVNGTAIPTTLVNPTTLTAIIPAADFLTVGTLQITVLDPAVSSMSTAMTFTVTAPAVTVVVSAPPTVTPGSQPTINFTITQPYPVDITATLTLGFAASTTPAVDDPSIQFAAGGRTLSFVIPANTVTVPTITLQAGTVAGTITVPITLTAGGANVTPSTLQPAVIVVPPTIPTISSVSTTRSGNQLTVVMHGFSNTREMVNAKFHFTPAAGASLDTTDLTIVGDTIFNANWFQTTASDQYGSTFTYTQIFNTSDDATTIGSVDVTLTNTVGASEMKTAQ